MAAFGRNQMHTPIEITNFLQKSEEVTDKESIRSNSIGIVNNEFKWEVKIMQKRYVIFNMIVFICFFQYSLSYAEGKLKNPKIVFSDTNVFTKSNPPKVVFELSFEVEGGPLSMTSTVEQTIPRYDGPPYPTISLGTFNAGQHLVTLFEYNVPSTPPERVCFNFIIPGGEMKDVCMTRKLLYYGGRMQMIREHTEKWVDNSSSHGKQSYLMVCKGGGDMEFNYYPKDKINISFVPSAKSATEQEPLPGTCAWIDRPLKSDEPNLLQVPNIPEIPFRLIKFKKNNTYIVDNPDISIKYLYDAFINSQKFYVQCYRSGRVFIIDKVGP